MTGESGGTTDLPPYRVIAGELRRRIEAGELRPGDRLPSTRALVRDHGVAMATATKALRLLQDEQLAHAAPGVGTVVGPPPKPRARGVRRTEPPVTGLSLDRAQIVRRSIEIADAEGLTAVSMRRLAGELGVSTMALYRYVGGKDSLVVRMVDEAFVDHPLPVLEGDWRERAAAVARTQWAAYRKHLWLAGAVTIGRPQLIPRLMPHTDALVAAFRPLGKTAAMYASITVFAYVRGVAQSMEIEEQTIQDTGVGVEEWVTGQTDQLAALISSANLTAFQELFEDDWDFDYDLDQLFEFGLGLVLDGFELRLSRRPSLPS